MRGARITVGVRPSLTSSQCKMQPPLATSPRDRRFPPMPDFKRVSRLLASSLFTLCATSAFAAGPNVVKNARHDTSQPLAQLAVGARAPSAQADREMAEPRAARAALSSGRADGVSAPLGGPLAGVSTVIGFDGQSAADNRRVFGFAFVPPDTNGAVGASQYVQMVNVTIAVYKKRDGAVQLGPAPIHSLWRGFGGLCENGGQAATFSDGGDPVVLYDHLADRWMVSQLQYDETFTKTAQCIAISTFPGKGFAGAQACAFDRAAMLTGAPASAICFQQPPSVSSLLPADLDGSTLPPAGAPNYVVGIADSAHLNLFRFHADFANPAASTFSGPVSIAVAPFNEICARATTASCIAQPEPGEKVDGLSDRLMFRLAYRNFGDHEALVVNHTVAGGALGGVRWYEIRNPQTSPTVYQQGTVVDPTVDYWLRSLATHKAGHISL